MLPVAGPLLAAVDSPTDLMVRRVAMPWISCNPSGCLLLGGFVVPCLLCHMSRRSLLLTPMGSHGAALPERSLSGSYCQAYHFPSSTQLRACGCPAP